TASGVSLAIVCPGLTNTSTTGTSLKSPMPGTTKSIAELDGAAGAAGEADSPSRTVRIMLPCETLSPTRTLTFSIVPAAGDGTSIDAFSLSSTTNGASLTI